MSSCRATNANGFPDVGAYVVSDGEIYRVVTIGTTIHTGDARGNYVHATVEAASWGDCADGEEHTARLVLA